MVKVKLSLDRSKKARWLQKFEALRILRQSAREGGKVVSLKHQPPLPPREETWHLFLLETKSNTGHSAAGKNKLKKNLKNTIGNQTHGVTACSAVSQPIADSYNSTW
jgi:hypothetical protein